MNKHAILGSLLLLTAVANSATASPEVFEGRPARGAHAATSLANVPLDFVANRGQWARDIKFAARNRDMVASFGASDIALRLGDDRTTALTLSFEGASPRADVIGEGLRSGHYNFAVGSDAANWRWDVPAYAAVRYRGLYPATDIRVREAGGQLEYEVLLAPDSDLDGVVVRARGASSIDIASDGALVIRTPSGALRQSPPVTWEELPNGQRRALASRFRIIDQERFGFEAPGRDPRLAMVVDPGLAWSTFLGGTSRDTISGFAAAGDGTGDLIVAGSTASSDFPTLSSLPPNGNTMFVARLSGDGRSLVYLTIFGGTAGSNLIFGAASDASGSAYVAGVTDGVGFPTTAGAYRRTPVGAGDGFVTKLNATGGIAYSTFIGGTGPERIRTIAVNPAGEAVVGGWTASADFPVTAGAYDTSFNTRVANDPTSVSEDAFISKLSADGSRLVYSTYFGGQSSEEINALTVDPQGFVTVVGGVFQTTQGRNLPLTADAFDRTFNGNDDIFVARFKLDGLGAADLKYATLLGGDNRDTAESVAFDPSNPELVTVAGWSFVNVLSPPRYPTTAGALKTTLTPFPPATQLFPHSRTGVVTRFRFPAGGPGALVWSTYFGGNFDDYIGAVAVDATGAAIVAGGTRSQDYPTTRGAFDRTYSGEYIGAPFVSQPDECFVARIGADGRTLLYSTFVGGSSTDCTLDFFRPVRIALLGNNTVAVAGSTISPDFPATAGSLQPAYHPGPPQFAPADDGFVTKLSLDADNSGDLSVATPTLSSPPNASAFPITGDVTLRWNAVSDVSGIEAYVYQISSDPTFARDRISYTGSVSTPSFVARSLSNGTHYWRVQAADRAGNLGAFSPAFSFATAVNGASPVLAAIRLDPQRVNGGLSGSATLFLNFGAVAPSGGAVVSLRSSDPVLAAVPATVTIPAGANSVSFTFATSAVAVTKSVVITGELGLTQANTLTLEPPSVTLLRSISVSPTSVTAGTSSTGTVSLSTAAPAGGAVVALSSNNAAATVPFNVTVPAGAASATFPITTSGVSTRTDVNISAGYGTSLFTTFVINPAGTGTPAAPTLLSPANGSTPAQPVTLDWSDVTGAASYILQVDDANTFSTPLVVNQTTTASQFTAGSLANRQHWWRVRAVSSSGTMGAWSAVRSFTPQTAPAAASLSTLTVAPSSVVGGNAATGTVTLTSAAPSGGFVVTLASSNTAIATVPASVTVPQGATSATFGTSTAAVSATTPVTITASANSVTRTATLNVTPPGQMFTLTVNATGRSGERVLSSPAGISVPVGSSASGSFASGTSITLSVTNGRDAIWSGACSSGGEKTRTCRFTLTGNASVAANVQ